MADLGHLPWRQAGFEPDRRFMSDDRLSLTRQEFDEWTVAVAEQFAEQGIGAGDVVAIMLPNRVELLVCLVAAWRLGAAATPINPAFTAREGDYQIDDAQSALVINIGPDAPHAGRPVIWVENLRRIPTRELHFEPTTSPDEIALLIYTSGSTGRPKGVMLSHANLDAMSAGMVERMELTDTDRCLLFLPLFHSNALFVSFLSPARVGAETRVMGRFSVEGFFEAVEMFRPTYFSAVPTIYSMLVAQSGTTDFSSIRFGVCGAAPASQELLTAVEQRFGFGLVEGYGLTEGSCASCVNPVNGVRKIGTVGPAMPGQRVEIMGPTGELLPAGERGEVVIQGANVMVGYLNRPEATAETLRDGWLHTGDVGILDEDGYLRIVDRIKDLIIRGGENLYPKEIEEVLHTHPGVLEAAVVGQPDPVYGEIVVAYIAPYPGSDVTEEALLETCRAGLTKVKVPAAIHIVEALPKNPVGKIDKPTLRREASAPVG
ncbi:class I adenylate-forming enzyme family protein [Nocardioides daejeonensis]|uniref:class I adenylate-forming enzyme family protein n=1 Tax=Nocardioides daejeonensis TaxID=1046556 RepID=UPI000D740ED8|nr:AMP-binding protein [Nocardioides daejeonensis]